jgi:hypothetical protein
MGEFLMKNTMKKTLLWTLLFAPVVALAGAPAPAPDSTLQNSLSTTQDQNLNDAYTAGTSYQNYEADTAAANTAQDIANQDASQISDYMVARQANTEAQAVGANQQTQASNALSIQAPAVNDGNTTAASAATQAPNVAQSGAANGQAYASSDFATQTSSITAATGVQMDQLTPNTDVSYALAGAGEQAVLNGLATGGYAANDNAYQAAMNAAGCGINAGCYAFWMGMNAMYQGIANTEYAANVAAAPALAAIDDAAALAHANSDAQTMFAQITNMTGVAQGTPVPYKPVPVTPSTDTSYTNAANTDWNSMQAAEDQNNKATVDAVQAWQQDAAAQAQEDAANHIASYDQSQARTTFFDSFAWMQAASIAQGEASGYQNQVANELALQQQNITAGNTSYTSANALAPSVGNELDSAASTAASTDATNVIQQIGSATGVAQ